MWRRNGAPIALQAPGYTRYSPRSVRCLHLPQIKLTYGRRWLPLHQHPALRRVGLRRPGLFFRSA
jgi:hypothetical protein